MCNVESKMTTALVNAGEFHAGMAVYAVRESGTGLIDWTAVMWNTERLKQLQHTGRSNEEEPIHPHYIHKRRTEVHLHAHDSKKRPAAFVFGSRLNNQAVIYKEEIATESATVMVVKMEDFTNHVQFRLLF